MLALPPGSAAARRQAASSAAATSSTTGGALVPAAASTSSLAAQNASQDRLARSPCPAWPAAVSIGAAHYSAGAPLRSWAVFLVPRALAATDGSAWRLVRQVDLVENGLWSRKLADVTQDVVFTLVQQIFEGIRDNLLTAAELKFNCFFLMPCVQQFPASTQPSPAAPAAKTAL